ncbi:MAG: hypothetical protein IT456_23765, partial [Planctomycetes bacterium]|nr:hypothetical protein [Planctomycetota bacterium]
MVRGLDTLRLLIVAVLLVVAPHLAAQCANAWIDGAGTPGVDGTVSATATWDPDGAGPATPVLVVAGEFTLAGSVLANNIATWDQ